MTDIANTADTIEMATVPPPSNWPLAGLRRFVRKPRPQERCEMCGQKLPPAHDHLIEPATRRLQCCCGACAILFSAPGQRFSRVPRRVERLTDFELTESQWEDLNLPINLAFFFFSSPAREIVALYPSPAGATESLVTLAAWDDLVAGNPVLEELSPDVEALLVNRVAATPEYFRAPIDECFKLVGLIRAHWRGLSGGTEAWLQIAAFFAELRGKAVPRTRSARHA